MQAASYSLIASVAGGQLQLQGVWELYEQPPHVERSMSPLCTIARIQDTIEPATRMCMLQYIVPPRPIGLVRTGMPVGPYCSAISLFYIECSPYDACYT